MENASDAKNSQRGGRARAFSGSPVYVLAACILVLAGAVGWVSWQNRLRRQRAVVNPSLAAGARTPWKNAQPGVKYVGDEVCARCHSEIADSYRQHAMGRSLSRLAEVDGPPEGTTTFQAGSFRYAIERRGNRVVHRESQLDASGQALAQVEAEVKYALGSGVRGISYLIERDDRLFQSPITWYSQTKRWDLSPGYEKGNLHFERPIEEGCLYCHANRVERVAPTLNKFRQPIFRGHAIGCERCHGPGELHSRSPELVGGRDLSIVNPGHLEPALRSAVCEQCHLQGDHRVSRLGRDLFDFRPGLPLVEFFAIYGRTELQTTRFVGQVEQMKESQCYKASQGRFGCTSCHDPHQAAPERLKSAYYRQQCLACHESQGCSLPRPARLAESRDDSCVQCHMPRFKMTDIIHTATTDHRVLRNARRAGPDAPTRAGGLPLVLLNGKEDQQNRDPLDRELAIALATEGPRLNDSPEIREMSKLVLALLDRAIAQHADDLPARRAKARVLALSGRRSEALPVIKSALAVEPDDEQALDDYLAYAVDEKDVAEALEHARRAVSANPWSSVTHERLAYFLLERHDYAGSLRESSAALRLNPFLRFARMFTIQSLLAQGQSARADGEFTLLNKMYADQRKSLEIWYAQERRK